HLGVCCQSDRLVNHQAGNGHSDIGGGRVSRGGSGGMWYGSLSGIYPQVILTSVPSPTVSGRWLAKRDLVVDLADKVNAFGVFSVYRKHHRAIKANWLLI